MGPCQGARNGKRRKRPCAAPLPWFPAFAGTTMGVCGSASAGGLGVGGPLRQDFTGRTDSGSAPATGSWGCDGGGDAPRRAPLDTGFRRYDDGGVRVGKCWRCWGGGGGPSSALRTRFDRLRANGLGVRALDGEWGMRWGRRRPAPRPSGYRLSPVRRWGWVRVGKCWRCWGAGAPFECPQDRLRQAQGERSRGAALRRGVGDAMGDGDDPRPAPLDTGFRRYDDGDVRGRQVLVWCWAGEGPAAAGRALREAPLQIERRWGLSCELEGAYH